MSCAADDARRKRQRARYAEIMRVARTHLGGRCAACDSTADLEVDHVDPSTKTAALTELWSRPALFWAELEKCQLLCHECHAAKTAVEREQRVKLARERKRVEALLEEAPF